MNEGALSTILDFIHSWPQASEQIILEKNLQGTPFIVSWLPDYTLKIRIGIEEFRSQHLQFTHSNQAIIFVNWNFNGSPKIEVSLNKQNLKEKKDTREILKIVGKPRIIKRIKSIECHNSYEICKDWINWRTDRYGAQKNHPKKNRKLKSINEQIEELEDSINSLKSHIQSFKHNEKLFLLNCLPILRALLFWSEKGKNYNPLLFRLAGYFKIALPLFAITDRKNELENNPPFYEDIAFSTYNIPSIVQLYPKQNLMDFQEWLSTNFVTDRIAYANSSFTMKDIIFESANTISATHFDDDTPLIVSDLREMKVLGKTSLWKYVMIVTELVIFFGGYIINNKNR